MLKCFTDFAKSLLPKIINVDLVLPPSPADFSLISFTSSCYFIVCCASVKFLCF